MKNNLIWLDKKSELILSKKNFDFFLIKITTILIFLKWSTIVDIHHPSPSIDLIGHSPTITNSILANISSSTKYVDCKEKLVFFLVLSVLQIREFKQCSPTKLNCSTITLSVHLHAHRFFITIITRLSWDVFKLDRWRYSWDICYLACVACKLYFYALGFSPVVLDKKRKKEWRWVCFLIHPSNPKQFRFSNMTCWKAYVYIYIVKVDVLFTISDEKLHTIHVFCSLKQT